MYVLGVNSGVRIGYRDASAVLLFDGQIVAAAEEERFNRIKGSPSQLPELSINYVLSEAGITMQDVGVIATHGITWGEEYTELLRGFLLTNFGFAPRILRFHHHDCHAAGAYYASGYDKAIILSADNSGDSVSTQVALGKDGRMSLINRIARPNSLGLFYGMITQFCGFVRDSDEYKLMGMASYGKPAVDLSPILKVSSAEFELNTDYLQSIIPGQPQPTIQQPIYSNKLTDLLGPRRMPWQPMTPYYMNVAASAQQLLQDVLSSIVREAIETTGIRKVCLSGGVALNCAANRVLMNLPGVESLFVQPAAGDAGISQGAAYLACLEYGIHPRPISHAFLGTAYSNADIERSLKQTGVRYRKLDDPAYSAAILVSEKKVIAWFQGKMEFGPRALGNRSILASPSVPDIKRIVNHKIKFRESFRPFCPSVIEEDAATYFSGKQPISPYMTVNYDANDITKSNLNGIVHVDGTARIQTVSKDQNELYFNYLNHLKEFTGHGVSLNTSFNVNHQPIVRTPFEAISTFYSCGLDHLVMGNYLLSK
jgi:carbamoyltransferase